jgi:hypothetical protein
MGWQASTTLLDGIALAYESAPFKQASQ